MAAREQLILYSVFFVCFFHHIGSFNLDIAVPLVKEGLEDSYFGYSVAQHNRSLLTGGPDNHEYVFLVGAPLATVKDKSAPKSVRKLKRPGAVYVCPMSPELDDCKYVVINAPGSEQEKNDGWLGVTVESQGTPDGKAVACAHRQKNMGPGYAYGNGLCVTLSNLLDEEKYLDPCQNKKKDTLHNAYGFCQAGSSLDVSEDGEVVIGTPGPFNWRGGITKNLVREVLTEETKWYWSPVEDIVPIIHEEPDPVPSGYYTYAGLSTKIGTVTTVGKDYITGAPRANGTGQVFFFNEGESDQWLDFDPKHVLSGNQFGQYFGHALALVDLNNDGLQDLVVSAPLYNDEEGQSVGGCIFVYMNSAGGITSQTVPIQINAPKLARDECASWGCHDARFGASLAGLGDVDQDGFEDLAVGAPYEGNGTLYIYRGGPDGIRLTPSQRIQGSQIHLARSPTSFASSLAGGMDMDENGYPDLVVGAHESRKVLVLRSRPVINILTQWETTPTEINPKIKQCQFNGEDNNCFKLKLYFRFTAKPTDRFTGRITLNYKLEAETFKGRKVSRVFFKGSGTNVIDGSIQLNEQTSPSAMNDEHLVFFTGNVRDFLNPIEMRVTYELKDIAPPIMSPGQPLPDINDYPILNEDLDEVPITVHFQKNCKQQQVCQSRLSVMSRLNLDRDDDREYVLKVGETKQVELRIAVENRNGEDAHEAYLHLDMSKHLTYVGATRDGKAQGFVVDEKHNTLSYLIGNPMTQNETARFSIRMEPSKNIPYSLHEIDLEVLVNTTSTELNERDNINRIKIKIVMETDLLLTGHSSPSEVQYSGDIIGESAIKKESEIGSQVEHTYIVSNEGFGTVPNCTVEIYWPYEVASPYPHGKHLLYLMQPPVISPPGKCIYDPAFINPINVEVLPNEVLKPSDMTQGLRNSRNTLEAIEGSGQPVADEKVLSRQKREQAPVQKDVVQLRCDGSQPSAKCTKFTCYMGPLQQKEVRRIGIRSYLWNSTFLENYGDSVRHIEIMSVGTVTIDPLLNIKQTDDTNDHHRIMTKATPDIQVVGSKGIQLWIIILAICGGILLLILFIFLLWKCGFFKRTKPGEMPEHKGTLQKKKKGQTAFYEDPYN